MEHIEFQGLEERINLFLQDYSNDFLAIEIIFTRGGIDGIRKLFKDGYRILSIEDYLQKRMIQGVTTISIEDQKESFFIEKSKKLNELAASINSLGENIDIETVREKIKEVKKITNN